MASKGTPIKTYPYKVNAKDLKKSYELRLAAQFGDSRAKGRLQAYNRRIKERKMEASKIDWVIDGKSFNRYKMMDFIVSRVANGEPLDEICAPEEMPSMLEVYSWQDNHPDFATALRRAEEVRGHRLGEEALRVAMGTDRENVAADKLKFEALSKAAARTNSRFQDKQVQEVRDEYGNMSADQIRERIKRMIEASPDLALALPEAMRSSLEMREPLVVPALPTEDHDGTYNADAIDVEPTGQEDHQEG